MQKYEVGVAIPNYNNGRFLKQCVDSIIGQTYRNLEIMVVDDCSTDNSIEVLERLKSKYPNVDYCVNEANSGVAYTRDKAIRLLDTEYITAIDSDDFYYTPEKIECELRLVEDYQSKGKDVVAYSNIIDTDIEGKFQRRCISEQQACSGECFEAFLTRSCRIPTCSLYAKKLYEKVGGLDVSLRMYEDWDLEIRLSKIAEFYYTGQDGFAYRHHHMGLSSAKFSEHRKWQICVFEKNSAAETHKNALCEVFRYNVMPTIFQRIVRKVKRLFL